MNSPAVQTVAPGHTPDSTWTVLRHPLFRSLWIANIASGIGSVMHDTTAAWVMTTSSTLVALMQSMASLPLFLLALPAGSLADIVDRRKVILVAQTGSLVVATADDKAIEDAVQAFHVGEHPPQVSHYLMKDIRNRSAKHIKRQKT